MTAPNRTLIGIFRGLLILILLLNIFNGAVSGNPRFSAVSAWGPLWQGLFLTTLISWMILETANYFFKKTRVGYLPAHFWLIAAGLNANDFFNSYIKLFEVENFDKSVHLLSSFFFGIIILGLARRIDGNYNLHLPKILFYYLIAATVNVGGILYEIGELIGDRYFGSSNITGAFDTTEDIIFNNIGLFLILAIDFLSTKIRTKKVR